MINKKYEWINKILHSFKNLLQFLTFINIINYLKLNTFI